MHSKHLIGLCLIFLVAGCARVSESRLNPFNWFGGSEEVQVLVEDPIFELDPRPLVESVTDLTVERTPGGAIIRASGLPTTQGWYDGELVPTTEDAVPVDGVISYTFRIREPETPTRVSTPQSRAVIVGVYLSEFELRNVRAIEVIGRTNTRTARR